jgi:hypothetical protein
MERNEVLNLRVPAEIKKALRAAALDDERTMSNTVAKILRTWLVQNGYLPKSPLTGRKTKKR